MTRLRPPRRGGEPLGRCARSRRTARGIRGGLPFLLFATPHRRAKVVFAGELAKAADAAVISPELTRTLAGRATTTGDSSRRGIFGWLTQPHLGLQWGFAAAALMLALVASYLLFVNRALMSRVMQVESLQLALDSKQREVLAELKAQSTPPVTVPPHAANSAPAIVNVVASVLLLPQTRGVAQPAAVLIDKGAATVPVELALEPSDGFKRFDVALKDPATGNASGRRRARAETQRQLEHRRGRLAGETFEAAELQHRAERNHREGRA